MPVTPTLNEMRPTKFSQIAGNENVLQRLIQQIRNRSFPRLCFIHGPSGAGKTTLARILAGLFFCSRREQQPDQIDRCGECDRCHKGLDAIFSYHEWTGQELTDDPTWWKKHGRSLLLQPGNLFFIDESQDLSTALQRQMRTDLEGAMAPVLMTTTHRDKIDDALLNRYTNHHYEMQRPTPDEAADAMAAICGVLSVQFERRQLLRVAKSLHSDMRKCAEFPRTVKAQTLDGKITDAFLDLVFGPEAPAKTGASRLTLDARQMKEI